MTTNEALEVHLKNLVNDMTSYLGCDDWFYVERASDGSMNDTKQPSINRAEGRVQCTIHILTTKDINGIVASASIGDIDLIKIAFNGTTGYVNPSGDGGGYSPGFLQEAARGLGRKLKSPSQPTED